MVRSVAWFEERQERAQRTVWRLERMLLRVMDRGYATAREAERMVKRTKAAHRKAAALAAQGARDIARSHELADRIRAMRPIAGRYGRAKAMVGVYDRAYGWRDAA